MNFLGHISPKLAWLVYFALLSESAAPKGDHMSPGSYTCALLGPGRRWEVGREKGDGAQERAGRQEENRWMGWNLYLYGPKYNIVIVTSKVG